MRYAQSSVVWLLLAGAVATPSAATNLSIALDIQGAGLDVAQDGVGLQDLGSGSETLTIDIGGPVQGALLYWGGSDRPCPQAGGICVVPFQPYRDQVLRFDGNLVTGTIIGTEGWLTDPDGPRNAIGYLADVTSAVQAKGTGTQSFTIADGDLESNLADLDGASLLVIYTDAGDAATYRVYVFDGMDFASSAASGVNQTTNPVTFNFAAEGGFRLGELELFVGDGEADGDRVTITANPDLVGALDGSAGATWDSDSHLIAIPDGATSATVQVVSEGDDLLWETAVLRIPLVAGPACTLTCAPDQLVETTSASGANVTFPAPTESGTCGTVTCTPASGSLFPVGSTPVSCTSQSQDLCSLSVTVSLVSVTAIPTLSYRSLSLLALLMSGFGIWALRRLR